MRDLERGVWAVVSDAGGKKYIGAIAGIDSAQEAQDRFLEKKPLKLTEAWSYIEMDLPINGPQGLGVQHITHCRPLNNCVGSAELWILAHTMHLLSDMEEEDRRRNKTLVEQVAKAAMEARAERSGLTLVGPGGMPQGGMPRGPRRTS